MNDLQVFKSSEFGEIRSVLINGDPYFVGKDVAEALGYAKPENAVGTHIDAEDKTTTLIQGTGSNYKSKAVVINESGLYALILSSKLPTAKKFKHWVTAEILPSIRKNGGYIAGQEDDPPEVLVAKALVVAQNIIAENQKKIAELTPKAEYFDALVERNLLTNLRDTAKELEIKERKFVAWLESKGFIYRDQRNQIKPFAPYITGEKRYFELKEWSTDFASGTQTLVTPRGKEAFRLLYKG